MEKERRENSVYGKSSNLSNRPRGPVLQRKVDLLGKCPQRLIGLSGADTLVVIRQGRISDPWLKFAFPSSSREERYFSTSKAGEKKTLQRQRRNVTLAHAQSDQRLAKLLIPHLNCSRKVMQSVLSANAAPRKKNMPQKMKERGLKNEKRSKSSVTPGTSTCCDAVHHLRNRRAFTGRGGFMGGKKKKKKQKKKQSRKKKKTPPFPFTPPPPPPPPPPCFFWPPPAPLISTGSPQPPPAVGSTFYRPTPPPPNPTNNKESSAAESTSQVHAT